MVYTMTYRDPSNTLWPVIAPGPPSGVWTIEEGLDGLVAVGEDATVTAVGRPGGVFGGVQFAPMVGSLTVKVRSDGNTPVGQVYRQWRAAWSRFTPGMLSVTGGAHGQVSCLVRAASTIPAPPAEPAEDTEVSVQVVADGGVWWTDPTDYTGTDTITNSGVCEIRPAIRWDGDGGTVILPSGASFTLPAVTSQRTLLLDDDESCVVLDELGTIDHTLWDQLSEVVLAEGVPVGQQRTFTVPDGAALVVRQGVDAPW